MLTFKTSIITLVVGMILGYLGQRSRFCTISGVRDFYLMRDSYRLKGFLGIIIGGIIGFGAVNIFNGKLQDFLHPGSFEIMPILADGFNVEPLILVPVSLLGAFVMAYFSVMAEGCPFRQHVIAGEGRLSGILYLLGLVSGVLFFDIVLVPILQVISLL
ncbi:MAG: YeeE/YedE family protein [Dehalococcoidales bacterium]|nr:YeeE/YedE family protein [Dehalococcoidales bacterium]